MLPQIVRIELLRNHPAQTSSCHPYDITRSNSPHETMHRRSKDFEIVKSRPLHATPDRPYKTFTNSPGENLHRPPCIIRIKPLRNRPEQTSTCYPDRPNKNLDEIVRSKAPHATPDRPHNTFTKSPGAHLPATPDRPDKNFYEICRSKPPHATPDRQEKTLTKSSGANLHMLPRVVRITPSRNHPAQTSTCYPASSR